MGSTVVGAEEDDQTSQAEGGDVRERLDRVTLKVAYLTEQLDRLEMLLSAIEPEYVRTTLG